jgi:hypothetical protein
VVWVGVQGSAWAVFGEREQADALDLPLLLSILLIIPPDSMIIGVHIV